MGTFYNPKIITGNLIFYLDAKNKKSYSGTGSIWYDLKKSGRNGTITNAVWSSNNGGIFTMTTAQYISIANTDFRTGQYTIMCATRLSGGVNQRIVSGTGNNYLLGTWSGRVNEYYSVGWVSPIYNTIADTNWRIYTGTVDTVADNYKLYSNTALVSSNGGGSQGPNGLGINTGFYINGTEKSNCEISFIMGYNRVLSADEIAFNFNNFRGRFNL